MIVKGARKNERFASASKSGADTRSDVSRRIAATVGYVLRDRDIWRDEANEKIIITNLDGFDRKSIIAGMLECATEHHDRYKSANEKCRHIIISPELHDPILSREQINRAVEIYLEKRGIIDAPYLAVTHSDNHNERHPQHIHLFYFGMNSNGRGVPTSKDFELNKSVSRQIEQELNLTANSSIGKKYDRNGRDQSSNRDRAAEKINESQDITYVDVEKVIQAVNRARSIRDLKKRLDAVDIECQFIAYKGKAITGWNLKNRGAKHWTKGSKLTREAGALRWAIVKEVLVTNNNAVDVSNNNIDQTHQTIEHISAAQRHRSELSSTERERLEFSNSAANATQNSEQSHRLSQQQRTQNAQPLDAPSLAERLSFDLAMPSGHVRRPRQTSKRTWGASFPEPGSTAHIRDILKDSLAKEIEECVAVSIGIPGDLPSEFQHAALSATAEIQDRFAAELTGSSRLSYSGTGPTSSATVSTNETERAPTHRPLARKPHRPSVNNQRSAWFVSPRIWRPVPTLFRYASVRPRP